MQDYWWVTRPKRKLNTIPEELAAFCAVALGKKWTGNRPVQIAFEEELEKTGTKRVGERRDASGSGGRTHAAMLYSLGLWFEKYDKVYLTLAGQAIMDGKSPVEVLKKQVLNFQYPSAYSDMRGVKVSMRFFVRPFIFLLHLLADKRLEYLTQEEIAFIVCVNAEKENSVYFDRIAKMIMEYRSSDSAREYFTNPCYLNTYNASKGNLMDIANTMMNWLDYTQLVYREGNTMAIAEEKLPEVMEIINAPKHMIEYPSEPDVFQRKYGVDPWHKKDTRNILNTKTVSSRSVEKDRILRAFFNYSSLKPVKDIDSAVVDYICDMTGTDADFTESVLIETYPHGAVGGYLSNYRSMAFQGRDEAKDFEIATTNLFRDIFGYETEHLGQTGSLSAPDVLLISDSDGYQAIVDNKAYSRYSISGDHHNRMVRNYLRDIAKYSKCTFPIGFFTYISGGFVSHIDKQIQSEADESGVNGSCITVDSLISLIEDHTEHPYTHGELRRLFGIDRQILLSDIHH